MNGIKRLLLRIIPFVMLFSFIAYGISIIFVTENITYLNTIEVNGQTMQYFDIASYLRGITARPLIDGFTRIFNIQPWINNIQAISNTFGDGYQIGDGIKTIGNGLICLINGIILAYNCLLLPVRMIAGLILTLFTIAGINITANTPIVTIMNGILNYYQIPFINIVIT